jgi:hypothetical protein
MLKILRSSIVSKGGKKYGRIMRMSTGPKNTIRIGCASGFWGDTPTAVPQLLNGGKLDYMMFDYLSELTMSLLTAAKAKKPEFGYAPGL